MLMGQPNAAFERIRPEVEVSCGLNCGSGLKNSCCESAMCPM